MIDALESFGARLFLGMRFSRRRNFSGVTMSFLVRPSIAYLDSRILPLPAEIYKLPCSPRSVELFWHSYIRSTW